MKKFICIILLLTIFACTPDEEVNKLNPTELEVTVRNESGIVVPGASVRLYRNLRDLESLQREVRIAQTGPTGVVKFSGLQPVNYFFYVSYEANGIIYSNYGKYNDDIGDYGSNYELADFLTENAITRISINTLFSRPLVPGEVNYESIQLFYQSEIENSFIEGKPDTSEIYLLFIEDFNYNQSLQSQISQVYAGQSNFLFDQSTTDIGIKYDYNFRQKISIPFIQSTIQGGGVFSPNFLTLPAFFDSVSNQYFYDSTYSFLETSINSQIIDAVNEGVYPNRVFLDTIIIGNDVYFMDLILNWQ